MLCAPFNEAGYQRRTSGAAGQTDGCDGCFLGSTRFQSAVHYVQCACHMLRFYLSAILKSFLPITAGPAAS